MDRRTFLYASIATLAIPLAAEAQAGKVYRIGVLSPASSPTLTTFEAFRQRLGELGYVEGQNITIEWRFAEGRYERFPELARDLVSLNVDVIAAVVTVAVQAAKQATSRIPIVMVAVHDPVGSGHVASLARPGGNVTGLSYMTVEWIPKQLELLREAFPWASRVAVLHNPASPPHVAMVKEAERVGGILGVQVHTLEARGPEDFDGAFSAMTRARTGALLVLGDGMFFLHRTRLAELAAKSRLPAMYSAAEHVKAGGLMAYSADLLDNWRRAAMYVDRILKGAKPGDLPIEQPTKFELVINMKTAKALGLTIPPSLLLRADHVIE